MALIRLNEEEAYNEDIMRAIRRYFDSVEEVWHDKYRKFIDYKVLGEGIEDNEKFLMIKIYQDPGINSFIIEVT